MLTRAVDGDEAVVEVICTPQAPSARASIRHILRALGYKWLGPSVHEADIVVTWEDTTFPKHQQYPVSRWGIPPINARCRDISKRRVGKVFAHVFGYELSIDPRIFRGPCVEKSDINARHDVKLRECPIDEPDGRRVYERYVDSMTNAGYYEDIRVAIVGNEVPLCFRRIKAGDQLAGRFKQAYDRSIPVPTAEVLCSKEIASIILFCQEMGIEFCELDTARDRTDGRLYIFDANPTPDSPPKSCSEEDGRLAVEVLADAFARQFQPRMTYVP
jgi:hypothetical protein